MLEKSVAIQNVSKTFVGSPALIDVSLSVPKGTVATILGPNGAGKTTLLRIITGALQPDSGTVITLGNNMSSLGSKKDLGATQDIRRKIGVVTAKPSLYDRLTGYDNLLFAAKIYGLTESSIKKTIEESAKTFGIFSDLDKKVGGYSTGMKTRLALSRSILGSPELLLFDEPTSGLDPESAGSVLEMIKSMATENKTVIMCTHLLPEAENLSDYVVVMGQGRVHTFGQPNDLFEQNFPLNTFDVFVRNKTNSSFSLSDKQKMLQSLRAFIQKEQWVYDVREKDEMLGGQHETLVSFVVESFDVAPRCIEALLAEGFSVLQATQNRPTLERLYFVTQAKQAENLQEGGSSQNE